MPNPDRLRCPECRTRRTDPRAFILHCMGCTRPLCHCGSYAYPHRPLGGMCTLNPDAQVTLASRGGTPGEELLDVAIDVALHMRGKRMMAWPFDQHGALRMKERDIERHLVKRVAEVGGIVRKVAWPGHRGAPDRLVMLPHTSTGRGTITFTPQSFWVELKAPGKKPEAHQVREHERLRAFGQRVEVIDSIEQVEALLA